MDDQNKYKKVIDNLSFKTKEIAEGKIDDIWNQINQKTTAESGSNVEADAPIKNLPKIGRRIMMWGTAAAVLLLAGFFFVNRNDVSIKTSYAEKIEHQLPDGSMVYLNAGSKVMYDYQNWDEDRTLTLIGEAFFEVEKGSQFLVATNLGKVKVLGTSFNVRARESFEVACFTGRVEVSTKEKGLTTLAPGQKAVLTSNMSAIETAAFELTKKNHWRDGVIRFEATKLGAILNEMERQHNVQISASEETANRSFTGNISLLNINESLNQICDPMNITFEGKGKKYRIIEK